MYAVPAAPQAKKPLYCKSHEKKAPAFRMPKLVATIEELIAPIEDGCVLVVPREVSGVPMEATRALIRRGVKKPGADRPAHIELAGRLTDRRRLRRHAGNVRCQPRRVRPGAAFHRCSDERHDQDEGCDLPSASCRLAGFRERCAVHAAARPDRLGHPEVPRRLEGDRQPVRPRICQADPIVLLPAIKPDVALFHAPMADRHGNVWIGRIRELATMAHAAAKTS